MFSVRFDHKKHKEQQWQRFVSPHFQPSRRREVRQVTGGASFTRRSEAPANNRGQRQGAETRSREPRLRRSSRRGGGRAGNSSEGQAEHASQRRSGSGTEITDPRTKDGLPGQYQTGVHEGAQAAAQEASLKGSKARRSGEAQAASTGAQQHRVVEYTQATDSTTSTEVCEWASKGQRSQPNK